MHLLRSFNPIGSGSTSRLLRVVALSLLLPSLLPSMAMGQNANETAQLNGQESRPRQGERPRATDRGTNATATGIDAADSMIFHASFDGTTDADLCSGSAASGRIYTAESTKRTEVLQENRIPSVSIAKREGRYGDALRFGAKTNQVLFYHGAEAGYRERDWSGSASLWLKLDPNKDLEPGFCDPIQITERGWNDGAFFVDFDKVLPRDFRLGAFPDYATWNPRDVKYDEIPVGERPMVIVKNPPFGATQWTHVCFTWSNINSSRGGPAIASLYLNGKLQGSIERELKVTWDPDRVAIMIGLNYIGLMDDLIIFRTALSGEQVEELYKHSTGGLR